MPRKVLIASESAYRRSFLAEMLSSHSEIILVDKARNGQETVNIIKTKDPDILILDIEYENREWLTPFNLIIKQLNIPTIVLTDINPKNVDSHETPFVLQSNDYVVKPMGVWKDVLPTIRDILISKVILANLPEKSKVNIKAELLNKYIFIHQSQKLSIKPEVQFNETKESSITRTSEDYFLDLTPISITRVPTKIVVIGASVGGPRTLRTILSDIPRDFPAPILVVQHLNHLFMRQLVMSLKEICKVNVKIGMNYEEINPGIIYLSPGDKHMQVTVKNKKPCIRTFEGELVNFCRPSVDVLFYSTARVYKDKTLGILLTGMGSDGASGLMAIRQEGGKTIAESEETSILYGMPKVAAQTGAANLIVPNYKIVDEMIRFVS